MVKTFLSNSNKCFDKLLLLSKNTIIAHEAGIYK